MHTHVLTHTRTQPAASPGPLPATPTGPGGSSVFSFNSPPGMVSPGKSFKPVIVNGNTPTKGTRNNMESSAVAASMQGSATVNYPTSAMLAGEYCYIPPPICHYLYLSTALPSPNVPGSFIFPPTTPTNQHAPVTMQGELQLEHHDSIIGVLLPSLYAYLTDTVPTSSTTVTSSSMEVNRIQSASLEPPAAKRSRTDDSSPDTIAD